MSEWVTHMTPDELMARIRRDRASFAALWAGLTDEQMTRRPGPQSDWSVKDLIAHISAWEKRMLDNGEHLRKGEPLISRPDIDTVNADIFAANKDRPLADIRVEFEAQMARLESALGSLSEDEINDAQRFPQLQGRPLLFPIIGDTFGHYNDHRSDLERYVNSLKS